MILPPGLYDLLLTREVDTALKALGGRERTGTVAEAEAPRRLADHLARVVERVLGGPGLHGDVARQIALCNHLLETLRAGGAHGDAIPPGDAVARAELLLAVLAEQTLLASESAEPVRPETPLSQDALLVHAPHEPALAKELGREVASADRIDLLCAFVVWSGIRGRARRWWPRWTTAGWRTRGATGTTGCCSWRTAPRSSPKRCTPSAP